MAIASSGIGVTTVDPSDVSVGTVHIKSAGGTAIVVLDGHRVSIDDETLYQRFSIGNRSFTIESGTIDYFTEV